MAKLYNLHPIILYAFVGFLLGIGHLVPALWWTVVPGIAAWFSIIVVREQSFLTAFLGGTLSFTIKSGLAIAFYFTTYPIEWLPIEILDYQLFIIGFYWSTVSLFLGVAGGFLAVLLRVLIERQRTSPYLLATLPFLWLGAEILAPVFFSLFTFGPGASLNASYTLGQSGYLLAEHSLLFLLSSFGGVYVLSLVAGALGTGLFYWLKDQRPKKILIATLCVLMLVISARLYSLPSFSPTLGTTVAVINTDFSGRMLVGEAGQQEREQQLDEAVRQALSFEPDVIVLPEDSRFLDPLLSPSQVTYLFEFEYGQTDVILIDSARAELEDGSLALRATIVDTARDTAYQLDKQYLVPQGEFFPYFYSGLLHVVGLGSVVDSIKSDIRYTTGPYDSQNTFPSDIPSVLFCFSDVAPLAALGLSNERRIPFIVHPVSHSWFHEPEQYWHSRDQMLRVQARFSNTPIVSAGNAVIGALYTAEGRKVELPVVAASKKWEVGLIEL